MLVEILKIMVKMRSTTIKTYSEMVQFSTFDERFEYLKLCGGVGQATFGFDRHINQLFYHSKEWKDVRSFVIFRDNGCDLGILGYEIHVNVLIHHINPMSLDDIINNEEWILNPDFLITTTHNTHNAIHFGSERAYPKTVLQRSPRDTKLW